MRKLMGDKELPLLEQVQLETDMNTYLVYPFSTECIEMYIVG